MESDLSASKHSLRSSQNVWVFPFGSGVFQRAARTYHHFSSTWRSHHSTDRTTLALFGESAMDESRVLKPKTALASAVQTVSQSLLSLLEQSPKGYSLPLSLSLCGNSLPNGRLFLLKQPSKGYSVFAETVSQRVLCLCRNRLPKGTLSPLLSLLSHFAEIVSQRVLTLSLPKQSPKGYCDFAETNYAEITFNNRTRI